MIKIVDAATILQIHYKLVEIFIDEEDPIAPPGPKSEALLQSAATRPHTGIGGNEKYTTVETKIAALFHSLIHNHPFHNGNKRTALVSILVSLDLNSKRLEINDDDLFDFVVAVAGHVEPYEGKSDEVVEEIAHWIKTNSVSRNLAPSTMKVSDFLEQSRAAGCRVRLTENGKDWLIQAPEMQKIIKFKKQTKVLDGQVVKRYFRDLGLSVKSGIHLDEFQDGDLEGQQLMIQYRSVLKRLART